MCAVNPSPIGKTFDDAALCEIVKTISNGRDCLLESWTSTSKCVDNFSFCYAVTDMPTRANSMCVWGKCLPSPILSLYTFQLNFNDSDSGYMTTRGPCPIFKGLIPGPSSHRNGSHLVWRHPFSHRPPQLLHAFFSPFSHFPTLPIPPN
jgi:hypothetical protein